MQTQLSKKKCMPKTLVGCVCAGEIQLAGTRCLKYGAGFGYSYKYSKVGKLRVNAHETIRIPRIVPKE